MGIKKETFAKYSSVFNQLNIRLRSIEYAGFSVLKLLKLSGVKGSGVVGVICADSQGKDEINFTVLENGFPLFTRDISLSGAADDLEKGEGAEAEGSLDKLKSEFRVSMDYYRRKFPTKNIKNMVIICGQDWRLDIETYLSELGLPNKFIDIAKVIGRSVIYSSSLAKSYSAAIFKAVNTRVSLDLIGSKAKAEKVSSGQIEALSLLKGLKIDVRFILLGVFMCAGVFAYGIIKRNPFEQELSVTLRERIQVSGVPADSGLESLELLTYKYNNTLKNLEDLIKNQLYVTETVNIVPRVLPQGLWLTRFFFSSNTEGGYELTIEGLSYLGDNDKEFQAVNSFLKSLNASSVFTKYFKNISIVSIDRKEFAREQVTQFVILCKTAVKAGR